MAHYRMLDKSPSAIITVGGSEKKIYDGNVVYLNDGDNFELRFFNPLPEKIGVEIIFNGIKKGDSFLVLNPGQDVILDRFLDEQRKMLFETYTIDGGNSAAVEAIAQNGIINFNFYKEKHSYPSYRVGTYGSSGTSGTSGAAGISGKSGLTGTKGGKLRKALSKWSPIMGDSTGGGTTLNETFTNSDVKNGNTRTYDGDSYTKHIEELYSDWSKDYLSTTTTITTSTTINWNNLNVLRNQNGMGAIQSPATSITEKDQSVVTGSMSNNYFHMTQEPIKVVETGRIEMGDTSNQELKVVELQFEQSPFYSVTYKMVPVSNKPREIAEIRQYCPECGYRLRKASWSFCPKCGEKL